jgi:hypothetical protein
MMGSGQRPRLLRNDQELGHHWLRLQLKGAGSNPEAIGAWIEVYAEDNIYKRQVMPTRSYLSQSELPVTVGLGRAKTVDRVVIHWPDETDQELTEIAIDQLTVVSQSAEQLASPAPTNP